MLRACNRAEPPGSRSASGEIAYGCSQFRLRRFEAPARPCRQVVHSAPRSQDVRRAGAPRVGASPLE
eukprot:2640985-Prymnesium_polylepis.1